MFSCMVQTNLPDGNAATDKVIDTGTEELYNNKELVTWCRIVGLGVQ